MNTPTANLRDIPPARLVRKLEEIENRRWRFNQQVQSTFQEWQDHGRDGEGLASFRLRIQEDGRDW